MGELLISKGADINVKNIIYQIIIIQGVPKKTGPPPIFLYDELSYI